MELKNPFSISAIQITITDELIEEVRSAKNIDVNIIYNDVVIVYGQQRVQMTFAEFLKRVGIEYLKSA